MKAAVLAAATVWLVAAILPSTLAWRYTFHNTPVEFLEALNRCIHNGGSLASIQTAKANAEIWNAIKSSNTIGPEYWTAGTQLGMLGSWIWLSLNRPVGRIYGYKNWNAGKPNDIGGKNCLSIGIKGSPQWNYRSCRAALPYICEYQSNTIGSG